MLYIRNLNLKKKVHCINVILGPKGEWPFAKACEWNLFRLEVEDLFWGINTEGSGALQWHVARWKGQDYGFDSWFYFLLSEWRWASYFEFCASVFSFVKWRYWYNPNTSLGCWQIKSYQSNTQQNSLHSFSLSPTIFLLHWALTSGWPS